MESSSSTFCKIGSETTVLSDEDIRSTIHDFLTMIGKKEDVVLLPPDFTRYHSQAGKITRFICEYYHYIDKEEDSTIDDKKDSTSTPEKMTILPALGTHAPMTSNQIDTMFGNELGKKHKTTTTSPFMVHDWRNDVVTIGHAPAEMVSKATNGMVNRPWPAQLNKHVWEKRLNKKKSLIVSIGQVVPHEVMGMANFNKNLFVGVGGVDAINLSHFIGAVYGMEKMMGRTENPLRSILNYASREFLQNELDLWYILTVMDTDDTTGELVMRGLYIGNDIDCYNRACELSLQLNFTMLERSPSKIVVYLNPSEFHSTWLGNKAIYRTRMAIADGGELIILAPGVTQFGEDDRIDELIRKYGYVGTPQILQWTEDIEELRDNLSAVAHLIHGSTEGRFTVTYCPSHKLSKDDIENVGYQYKTLEEMQQFYDVTTLKDGWNTNDEGEEFYYISNPALGLWAVESRFETNNDDSPLANKEVVTTSLEHQMASDHSGGVGGWMKPPPST